MVEPPGNFGRAGIFEVHDGIFVTIEIIFVEQSSGPVQKTGENKFHVVTDPFAIET
jgi:hypothetical protein